MTLDGLVVCLSRSCLWDHKNVKATVGEGSVGSECERKRSKNLKSERKIESGQNLRTANLMRQKNSSRYGTDIEGT